MPLFIENEVAYGAVHAIEYWYCGGYVLPTCAPRVIESVQYGVGLPPPPPPPSAGCTGFSGSPKKSSSSHPPQLPPPSADTALNESVTYPATE